MFSFFLILETKFIRLKTDIVSINIYKLGTVRDLWLVLNNENSHF